MVGTIFTSVFRGNIDFEHHGSWGALQMLNHKASQILSEVNGMKHPQWKVYRWWTLVVHPMVNQKQTIPTYTNWSSRHWCLVLWGLSWSIPALLVVNASGYIRLASKLACAWNPILKSKPPSGHETCTGRSTKPECRWVGWFLRSLEMAWHRATFLATPRYRVQI